MLKIPSRKSWNLESGNKGKKERKKREGESEREGDGQRLWSKDKNVFTQFSHLNFSEKPEYMKKVTGTLAL